MGRKKKYTYSETQNGEEIMTEVETKILLSLLL